MAEDYNLDLDGLEEEDGSIEQGAFEVSDDLEQPHINVKTEDIKKFVLACSNLIVRTGRDIVTKSIELKAENSNLILRATDLDIFIEYKIPLQNRLTNTVLKEPIYIPYQTLAKVVKESPNSLIVYKENDNLYFKLYGGSLIIESYSVDEGRYLIEGDFTEEGEVDYKDFYEHVKNLGKYTTYSSIPLDRRLVWDSKGVYATAFWSILFMKGNYPDFSLKTKDLSLITPLLEEEAESNVKVSYTEDKGKCLVEFDNVRYLSPVSEYEQPLESVRDKFDSKKESVSLDAEFLQKYSRLADSIPYLGDKILLTSKEGEFTYRIPSNYGQQTFILSTSTIDNFETAVQAKMLKSVVDRLRANTVDVYYDEGVFIYSDGICGFIASSELDEEKKEKDEVEELMDV